MGSTLSHDIEDILNLIDGRPELLEEVRETDRALQTYITTELAQLILNNDFGYAVQSQAGDTDREALLFERLEMLVGNRI